MKRTIGLVVLGAVGSGSLAVAGDDAGSWYFDPMLQYHLQGNAPPLKDDFGYQGGFGYNLPRDWAIEVDANQGTFDIKGTEGRRRLTGYSADVIKKFFPDSVVQPYVLAGGGGLSDTTSYPGSGAHTYNTFIAEAGAGLLTGLGSQLGSTRVQLRTEAKYRMEWANPGTFGPKNPSALMFGIGVQMNFGAPNEIPPVVKEVVREVQVASPPPPPLPAPPPPQPAPTGEIRLQGVLFATNSSELIPESATALDNAVRQFQQFPSLTVEVRGYTDSRGSAAYNLNLSQRRAESVMSYLKTHGMTNPMTAKGFGKDDPIADNTTKDGQLTNRRVTLHIVGSP